MIIILDTPNKLVYLPKFAIKEGNEYAALDYYRHLVSNVDVLKFDYASIKWDLSEMLEKAKDTIYTVTLDEDLKRVGEHEAASSETDSQIVSWLVASVSIDCFSFKQLRTVVERVVLRVLKLNPGLKEKLSLVKFELRQRIAGFIERETDRVTHKTFDKLFMDKRLCFYLQCVDARFELPPKVEVRSTSKRLTRYDGDQIQPQPAWQHYTSTRKLESCGVLAVTVADKEGGGDTLEENISGVRNNRSDAGVD